MSTLDRERILTHLRQLPSLSPVVAELLASFADESIDSGRIAEQIARDQGLTARVLRVANSSFYGLQHKVGTINDAVVVLGFRAVRSMVLAIGVNGAFRVDSCPGFDGQAYLRHCVLVGAVARGLAGKTGHHAELAFTCGLLHDIGELVLAANFSPEYDAVLAYRQQHDCFLVVAERDVLGIDHAEVGGLLAEAWRFPEVLREAIAAHHAPAATAAASLADLIHVADAVAHGLGIAHAPGELVMPVDRTAWQRLNMNGEKIRAVLPAALAGLDEAGQAFSF